MTNRDRNMLMNPMIAGILNFAGPDVVIIPSHRIPPVRRPTTRALTSYLQDVAQLKTPLASAQSLLDICTTISGMKLSILRTAALFFLLPACAFAANSVLNLSRYDLMRPDFVGMT